MDKICLDTDFLVDFLRGKEDAAAFVSEKEGAAVLSTTYVTLYELYVGAYKSGNPAGEIASLENLKKQLQLLNLSDSSVRLAGQVRADLMKKGSLVDVRDLLIGTIALANGFSIKTNNKKHFSRIPGLALV